VSGKRTYRKPNKKKLYADGTVFCLRYSVDGKRRWETLAVPNLNAALAARATKVAALLTDVPATSKAAAKRIKVDDAITIYLNNVEATRAHRTWLAYTFMLNGFRKSCSKEYLDQIDKGDLTAFVVALKKEGQDDRTVANRVAGVVTLLRAHGIVTVTVRHKYTEKKVKAYSVEELRTLNAASTDEELQIWQFFLGTGFREDEVAHACDTDVDFKLKTFSVLEKTETHASKTRVSQFVPRRNGKVASFGAWATPSRGNSSPVGTFFPQKKRPNYSFELERPANSLP
jgi:integrase/recombinase XerD